MNETSPILPSIVPNHTITNSTSSYTFYSLLYISLFLNFILILIPILFIFYHNFGKIKRIDATTNHSIVTSFSPYPPHVKPKYIEQMKRKRVQNTNEKRFICTKKFKEYCIKLPKYEETKPTISVPLPPSQYICEVKGELFEDTNGVLLVSKETISQSRIPTISLVSFSLDLIDCDHEIWETTEASAITTTTIATISGKVALDNHTNNVLDESEDENDLDATWKIFTEGGEEAKTRNLRKCETWDAPQRTSSIKITTTTIDVKLAPENYTNNINPIEELSCISDIEEKRKDMHENDIDSTWKKIMEEVEETNTRKLRKCETWDVPPRVNQKVESNRDSYETWEDYKMRKSESFNDSVSWRRRGGMRRGESLTPDEANIAFEAFIKNVKRNIRLEKQQSLLKYK